MDENQTQFGDLGQSANKTDDGYDFDNWETVELEDGGDAVVGTLEAIIEEVGKYDSTVYLIETDDGRRMVFGNGSIDAAVEKADPPIESGDMVGFKHTGETYENDYGEFPAFDVRYQKA